MYRRILVPVDGSKTGALGLREAIRLAKDQGAKLRLVHIVDKMAIIGMADAGIDPGPVLARLARSGRALLKQARETAKKLGVESFEQTLQRELNGYSSLDDIPAYRVLSGELVALNPYQGYIPVIIFLAIFLISLRRAL